MKNIAIIGGGIGGLTTAIALHRKGFNVEVFESAKAFGDVGSGINLAINATQIFKRLGIYEKVKEAGNIIHSMKVRGKDLSEIITTDFRKMEEEFGVQNITIHRYALHQVLLKQLDNVAIHNGKSLLRITEKTRDILLEFDDGTIVNVDLVIGADGIHSVVRKSLFGDTILRDANQVCWRGISSMKDFRQYQNELNEVWEKGKRFGFVNINETDVYWYALIDKNRHKTNTSVHNEFCDFHPDILKILDHTPKEKIIFNEIWDLKPIKRWQKGKICVLGDAAHATTPNMGQGACQAIESAWQIVESLTLYDDVTEAFTDYQNKRIKRAHYVVNTSWKLGKMAQSNNPFVIAIRNAIMKMLSNRSKEKQNRKLFKIN